MTRSVSAPIMSRSEGRNGSCGARAPANTNNKFFSLKRIACPEKLSDIGVSKEGV